MSLEQIVKRAAEHRSNEPQHFRFHLIEDLTLLLFGGSRVLCADVTAEGLHCLAVHSRDTIGAKFGYLLIAKFFRQNVFGVAGN